ncbi:MAG: hypothetical protein M1833_004934 [Piccolia ochrophora]|nr:MAG: hypothetical protein M1833_004934 [Piccolia ochrophora]
MSDVAMIKRQEAAAATCAESGANELLCLLANPFSSKLQANAFWVSLGTSIGFTLLIALLFSLLRPHNTTVYAPKLKHADEKHAPPSLGKGIFAWTIPILKTRETHLVDKVGLDATVFLRFCRMCRNLFLVMSVIGCGVLIPANVLGGEKYLRVGYLSAFDLMSPLIVLNKSLWAHVVCSWLFDIIIAYFLWSNYRAVVGLIQSYFKSAEYLSSLHSRTLMITQIPNSFRTDAALGQITDTVNLRTSTPFCAIGRNVRGLPELMEQHEHSVRQLESLLAKYLKNPNSLPASRPTCKPSKEDGLRQKGHTVDAIDYLTERISRLQYEINDARKRIDKRNPMNYGFVSYESVPEAHAVAYAARKAHPKGATVALAPTPKVIVWDSLPLTDRARRWKRFTNGWWVALLTVIYVVPNALIAIFLTDLSKLGLVWPAFQTQLTKHPVWWGAVQGVASPAVTSLIYLLLPILFRRLSTGDKTKTSREKHVVHQLYAFFVFNNIVVFTLFSAIWKFVATVKSLSEEQNIGAWEAIQTGELGQKIATALCTVSPFWVTWILQRNLAAAVDLSQFFNLVSVWFAKKFMHPTARQLIEWTAPPPFDYASYYNYFLFYATVALCFATLQPLVLVATALYFVLDSWLKKYLLMYVFVTKNESNGQFWRMLYNRLVFAAIAANIIVGLLVFARGHNDMAFAMIPPPFLMLGFKWYCSKTFDDDLKYFTKTLSPDLEMLDASGKAKAGIQRVADKFAHPVFQKKLMTPMVRENAKPLLQQVYRGHLHPNPEDEGSGSGSGFISMDAMSANRPGKSADPASSQWEVVPENHLDFGYFKNRAEFGDEHGSGNIYGRPLDTVSERSGTPMSFMHQPNYDSPPSSRASSPGFYSQPGYGRPDSRGPTSPESHVHPAHREYSPGPRVRSPPTYGDLGVPSGSKPQLYRNDSEAGLLREAHEMPRDESIPRDVGVEPYRSDSSFYRPGYSGVPQQPTDEPTSYDYFRGRR